MHIFVALKYHYIIIILDQELTPYRFPFSCSSSCCCWGRCSSKSLKLHRFKSDRDEIWQDCSSSKYTSIDGVRFLIPRHTFNMAAMTSARRCSVRRLPVSQPSACDVTGSLYALQFLIHSIFILVFKIVFVFFADFIYTIIHFTTVCIIMYRFLFK